MNKQELRSNCEKQKLFYNIINLSWQKQQSSDSKKTFDVDQQQLDDVTVVTMTQDLKLMSLQALFKQNKKKYTNKSTTM